MRINQIYLAQATENAMNELLCASLSNPFLNGKGSPTADCIFGEPGDHSSCLLHRGSKFSRAVTDSATSTHHVTGTSAWVKEQVYWKNNLISQPQVYFVLFLAARMSHFVRRVHETIRDLGDGLGLGVN